MKKIVILGSTGSIGIQSLEVCEALSYQVLALTANRNVKLLEQQARKYKPKYIHVMEEDAYRALKTALRDMHITILQGMEGLCEIAALEESDIVLNSVVGMVGLQPTLAAIEAGKNIALANKETLVTGGKLVIEAAKKHNVHIYPVDSEHSAIFQCLQGHNCDRYLNKIILTASGGPFFGKNRKELAHVSVEDALAHPNWNMGAKITVDCATMMNKGLELIEAVWLFNKQPEDIEIVVHRESIVHSLVEFSDYAVLAQLGVPDMRIPIQYALTYPQRMKCSVKRLSLTDCAKLTFYSPDEDTFTCLKACKQAIAKGGLLPCIANGANEMAVELFLNKKIGFLDIGNAVQGAVENFGQYASEQYSLNDVLQADKAARDFVQQLYL